MFVDVAVAKRVTNIITALARTKVAVKKSFVLNLSTLNLQRERTFPRDRKDHAVPFVLATNSNESEVFICIHIS